MDLHASAEYGASISVEHGRHLLHELTASRHDAALDPHLAATSYEREIPKVQSWNWNWGPCLELRLFLSLFLTSSGQVRAYHRAYSPDSQPIYAPSSFNALFIEPCSCPVLNF